MRIVPSSNALQTLERASRATYRRRMLPRIAFSRIVVALAAGALLPASASAAPLTETEPNETVVTANGPIPADGWISTRNTSNDRDYSWVNLRPQQQVTLSMTSLGGCGNVGAEVQATDALGREHLDASIGSYAWTTPDLPVRLDIRAFDSFVGCVRLFKVSPASAILDGPLPAPPPRGVQIGLPATVTVGSQATFTLAGAAYLGDKVGFKLMPASSGPCATSRSYPASLGDAPTDETWSGALLPGAFTIPVSRTPLKTGTYVACAWVLSSDDSLPDLVASAGVAVKGKPGVSAKILNGSVPLGQRVLVSVANTSSRVLVTFTRNGRRVKTANVRPRAGVASISTSRLKRKTYRVSVWLNGKRLTTALVTVV